MKHASRVISYNHTICSGKNVAHSFTFHVTWWSKIVRTHYPYIFSAVSLVVTIKYPVRFVYNYI